MHGPLGVPTGPGFAAVRPPRPSRPAAATTIPALHCPEPLRHDDALATELDARLREWAEHVGIYPGRIDHVLRARFGRLIMLCYPQSDDVERLMIPARCTLAAWALDDHYCDDTILGAAPELVGSRLAIAAAAVHRIRLPSPHAAGLDTAVDRDPVLQAVRSAVEHLAHHATPAQVSRAGHVFTSLFLALGQEATWRATHRTPAVWEYLVNRQFNSFGPCLSVIDLVGGYELDPALWADPRIQQAFTNAALAASLVNDLYSLSRETAYTAGDFNLPLAVAAEEHCTLQEAVERTAAVHDDLMRHYEQQATSLTLTGPPELGRFLAGITAWCGGNHAWHRNNPRYYPTDGAFAPH